MGPGRTGAAQPLQRSVWGKYPAQAGIVWAGIVRPDPLSPAEI